MSPTAPSIGDNKPSFGPPSDGRINVLATAAPENEPAAPAQGANLEQPAGSPAREREIPGAGEAGNRDAPA